MELWTGFWIGLLGSLHCLGMCGPIALAIPKREGRAILDASAYNLGRVLTYSVMGILVGAVGASIALAGYQRWISMVLGALLLVVIVLPGGLGRLTSGSAMTSTAFVKFKSAFQATLARHTLPSLLLLGFLNGLLPCGLVYVALAAAFSAGSVSGGVLMMAAFGLGTIPMMATVYLVGNLVPSGLRTRVGVVLRVGVACVGILLILRGLSLGIPYLSPIIGDDVSSTEMMHHH